MHFVFFNQLLSRSETVAFSVCADALSSQGIGSVIWCHSLTLQPDGRKHEGNSKSLTFSSFRDLLSAL